MMMKKNVFKKISMLALVATLGLTFVSANDAISLAQQAHPAVVKPAPAKPAVAPIQLVLVSEKKVAQRDEQGKLKIIWKPTNEKANVSPGDVLRYTVHVKNVSEKPISSLAVTQPVPSGTIYTLDTAASEGGAKLETLFSIDGGKTFTAKPSVAVTLGDGKIEVRSAPSETYTHIRWKFESAVPANFDGKLTYRVHVR